MDHPDESMHDPAMQGLIRQSLQILTEASFSVVRGS
jgi:hypothetical protein